MDFQVPIALKLFFLSFSLLFATGCTNLNTANRLPQNITFLTFSSSFFANSDNGCSSTHWDFRFFSLFFLFKILPSGVQASINLIACQEKWNLGKRFFVVIFVFIVPWEKRLVGRGFFPVFSPIYLLFLKEGQWIGFCKRQPSHWSRASQVPRPTCNQEQACRIVCLFVFTMPKTSKCTEKCLLTAP